MRAKDLEISDLLKVDPEGGRIQFGNQRSLLLDAVALGLLKKQLVDLLGFSGARGVLTQFGYSHGWRTADSLEHGFAWDDAGEWRKAGGRLHTLQGLVRVEALPEADVAGEPVAASLWHDSYEAQQHLLQLGQAEEPVCWTLTGFASGYMTRCHQRPVYAIETTCVGKGDPVCQVELRPKESWEPERLALHLPFYEGECLNAALSELTQQLRRAERRLRRQRRHVEPVMGEDPPGLIARSAAMRNVVSLAERVARVDSTVLVRGESGVGKEKVARLVHDSSPRAHRPWVALNCGAMAEHLVESELFGHAKGAFTGAARERIGLFEAASGGTLFLDEVGELPPATQVKLLRVLQEREVRRLGENAPRKIDVRVVAATNRDLSRAVEEGTFRQDLLYRLRVFELVIPPLRERRDDVLPLATAILTEVNERLGTRVKGYTSQAVDQLLQHGWPGNVRELANCVERAAVVAQGTHIDVGDLPEEVRVATAPLVGESAPARTLADLERAAIRVALAANDGHRARTAAQLGIGEATLYRKIKQSEL